MRPLKIKILAALTVIAALAAPLSAASSAELSTTYGGAFGFMKTDSDINGNTSNWVYSYRHMVSVDLTRIFDNSMGVRVGFSCAIPEVYREYGVAIAPDDTVFPRTVKPYASFRYRIPVSQAVAFEAGAGLYAAFGSKIYDGIRYAAFEAGAEIDGALIFMQFNGNVMFGLKASVPFCSTTRQDVTDGGSIRQFGAEVIPYIGFSLPL